MQLTPASFLKEKQMLIRLSHKSGFTLVELSIVLVIIGLLVGGILIAQTVINTVKIQAQVRQFQQFDIAISNFKNKFNSLPGDSKIFPNGGNNNGKINGLSDGAGDGSFCNPEYAGEQSKAWLHLQQGVSLHKNYNFDETGSCPLDECKFKGDLIHIVPAEINDETGIGIGCDTSLINLKNNIYYFSSWDGGATVEEQSGSIKCTDFLAIDNKIDDGVINTGVMRKYGGLDCSDLENLLSGSLDIFAASGNN